MPGVSGFGLCDRCAHQKLVQTGRGSVFSMCLKHKTDERYAKYPRVPVGLCPGFVDERPMDASRS
jgi:hypothetical protein